MQLRVPLSQRSPGLFPRLNARSVIWRHSKAGTETWKAARGTEPATIGSSGKQKAGPLPKEVEAPSEQQPSATAAATYFSEIYIKDFALVSEQRVQLEPGLNVITGESGSGKSVLVEALGQLLGAPALEEAVRQPAEVAVLEGRVDLAPQEQYPLLRLMDRLGVPYRALPLEGVLMLRRELVKGADGVRSRCFLNGCPTSVRVLREVGRMLVDVNGQHAALALKDSSRQLALLDEVAGTARLAEALGGTLGELSEAQAKLEALAELGDEEEREEMQLLVDRVNAAKIKPEEDELLRRELRKMESRRTTAERIRLVAVGLGGGGGAEGGGIQEAIRSAEEHVRAVLRQEEALREGGEGDGGEYHEGPYEARGAEGILWRTVETLSGARYELEQAQNQMAEYAKHYRFSQADYDDTYSRLQELQRLMKRYDVGSTDELRELAKAKSDALDDYFRLEKQAEHLKERAQQLEAQAQQEAVELSTLRREAAGKLRAAVEGVLRDLAMAESRFDVRVAWTPVAGSSAAGSKGAARRGAAGSSSSSGGGGGGRAASLSISEEQGRRCWEAGGQAYRLGPSRLDTVEFMFAAGPAEPLRPLSAVASGGESARIMLALKAAPSLVGASGHGWDAAGEFASAVHRDEGSSSDSSGGEGGGSPIMILDEIDSGVGSRLGQPVGRILRSMVQHGSGTPTAQILCVSHLPQVAAHAQHHICVRKSVGEGDRMVTCFDSLRDTEARLQEVSAMLGLPLSAAQELMAAAKEGGQ